MSINTIISVSTAANAPSTSACPQNLKTQRIVKYMEGFVKLSHCLGSAPPRVSLQLLTTVRLMLSGQHLTMTMIAKEKSHVVLQNT